MIGIKKARLDEIAARVESLRQLLPRYNIIEVELQAMIEAYYAYSQKYQEYKAREMADIESRSNVKVLAWAELPLEPSFPQAKLLLPVGFIALSPKKYILDGDGFT